MGETDHPLQKIITKCWEDDAFKERLLADPATTLAAEGVQIPEGMTVNVAVDAEAVRTLVIPLPPVGALNDEELTAVAGGAKGINFEVACWGPGTGRDVGGPARWRRPPGPLCPQDGAPLLD